MCPHALLHVTQAEVNSSDSDEAACPNDNTPEVNTTCSSPPLPKLAHVKLQTIDRFVQEQANVLATEMWPRTQR